MRIGQGTLVSGRATSGVIQRADAVPQVIALMGRDDLDRTILLVESAAATAIVPLLDRVGGIVCCSGGATSHLSLVSKEFGLPCVMGAELDLAQLPDGTAVTVGDDGAIHLA
jgi:phosphohistidine swiveling domain-containing protein